MKHFDRRLVNLRDAGPTAMQQGDIVVVPRSPKRVIVVGNVSRPGTQLIPDGGALSVAQALELAGGPTPYKDSVKVTVLRQGEGGKIELVEDYVLPRDADSPKLSRALKNGDVVHVKQ